MDDNRPPALAWIDVAALADIPRQGARRISLDGMPLALFRAHDDAVFALDDHCPHKGGPLSQGIVHGHKVACPLHNWVIDLASGDAVAPDHGCVRRTPARVVAGRVEIAVPDRGRA